MRERGAFGDMADDGFSAAPPPPMSDAYFRGWADNEPIALFIVTRQLNIIWRNPMADRLLKESQTLRDRGGMMVASTPRAHQALARFAKIAGFPDETGRIVERNHVVVGDESDKDVVLRATAVAGHEDRLVTLMVRRASDRSHYQLTDLTEAFHMTTAESRVASMMISGATAEEIARALNISVETVRSHIKHIYAKTGVSSREALLSKLIGYMVR